jgi:hypothetical protein
MNIEILLQTTLEPKYGVHTIKLMERNTNPSARQEWNENYHFIPLQVANGASASWAGR